ncbi:hypothetical protein LHJ74_13495 [Streptomyces sp. N2-109]|uniref:Uncharacterized protein n=1 Tax=Streptomyces gossypii TaxID=2883101 RepID=A0ABT2JSU6_9ACTN|nr:hypothetical protein [Streptomyces gossypii]MCT2590911.1 hypothetical protein [Streptomyces gossypii]
MLVVLGDDGPDDFAGGGLTGFGIGDQDLVTELDVLDVLAVPSARRTPRAGGEAVTPVELRNYSVTPTSASTPTYGSAASARPIDGNALSPTGNAPDALPTAAVVR